MEPEIEDLILNHLTGDENAADRRRLQSWIAEGEENRKLYEDFCALWYSGVMGGQNRRRDLEAVWQRILRQRQRQSDKRRLFRIAAVAACMALALGSLRLLLPETEKREPVLSEWLAERGKPEKVMLVLSSGEKIPVSDSLRRQEAGVCISSDSSGLAYTLEGSKKQLEREQYHELIVPKCGEYRLTLADGTDVMLNAESSLRFPVQFSDTCREVWLTGEAYFDVTAQPQRPFRIHLAHASVRVLGTSFNIMSYEQEEQTEITLVRGKLEVGSQGKRETLLPGQQARVDHRTLEMNCRAVDPEPYVAWKDGILRFDDLPLEQLMYRLSRWYNIDFVFRQEELKTRLFTGGVRRYEKIEKILEMIQEIHDVKFSVENNKVVVDKR